MESERGNQPKPAPPRPWPQLQVQEGWGVREEGLNAPGEGVHRPSSLEEMG